MKTATKPVAQKTPLVGTVDSAPQGIRKPADVAGVYQARYAYGTETLALAPNKTYQQIFVFTKDARSAGAKGALLKKGVVRRNAGKWSLALNAPASREIYLNLQNALLTDDGTGQPIATPKRAFWILPVTSLQGKTAFVVNKPRNTFFVKQR